MQIYAWSKILHQFFEIIILIWYSWQNDDDGYLVSKLKICYIKDGKNLKMNIKQYIGQELDISHHELLSWHVLIATRYFNHKVKKHFTTIVMGWNNHMCVKHHTYKAEFQEKGAGHIHGTLRLDLKEMEKKSMVYEDDNLSLNGISMHFRN